MASSDSPRRETTSAAPDADRAKRRHHTGTPTALLAVAGGVAVAVALVLAIYGYLVGSLPLIAFALPASLLSVYTWLAHESAQVRRAAVRLAELRGAESLGVDTRHEIEVLNQTVADGTRFHRYYFVAPVLIVLLLAGLLVSVQARFDATLSSTTSVTLALLGFALSCFWLVMSRAVLASPHGELPEHGPLALACRELQWGSFLVSAGFLLAQLFPGIERVIGFVLIFWTAAVCIEHLVRFAATFYQPAVDPKDFDSPIGSLLREAFLRRGNPIASIFLTIERQFGVSLRSSWAIRFVRMAVTPTLVVLLILFWGLSSLAVVELEQYGVRYTMGRLDRDREPLPPGLHFTLPWPFGHVERFPVKRIETIPVGFDVQEGLPDEILWTESHGEEFALVLGDESEVLAINLIVSYKISEDPERFFDYVLGHADAPQQLQSYAYQALLASTRSKTLEEVLATDRDRFASAIEDEVRRFASEGSLGLDVLDVTVINLHPPVEAAPHFLDVVNAQIDARRELIEARGFERTQVPKAEEERDALVSEAKLKAAQQQNEAIESSSAFEVLATGYSVDPEAFRERLRTETLERVLKDEPLTLIDEDLAEDALLDKRPIPRDPLGGGF